uniref:hypothetical protein n=1 Tax=Yoonia sp. TaxID=2212373 RepID=UPI004048D53C
MENAPLVGTWSLCSWYNQTEDGRRLFPFGKDLRLSAAGALLGGHKVTACLDWQRATA